MSQNQKAAGTVYWPSSYTWFPSKALLTEQFLNDFCNGEMIMSMLVIFHGKTVYVV